MLLTTSLFSLSRRIVAPDLRADSRRLFSWICGPGICNRLVSGRSFDTGQTQQIGPKQARNLGKSLAPVNGLAFGEIPAVDPAVERATQGALYAGSAAHEPETSLLLRLEAARTGVLLTVHLLESVIFRVQRHAPDRADPISTKVAQTPGISQIVGGLGALLVSCLAHVISRLLAAASIADLEAKLPGCVGAKRLRESLEQLRFPELELL